MNRCLGPWTYKPNTVQDVRINIIALLTYKVIDMRKLTAAEGLQFPTSALSDKPSTTLSAKQIIQSALQAVQSPIASKITREKNWRKNYPVYFKALVEAGIASVDHSVQIAQQGLSTAQQLFVFNRGTQQLPLADAMNQFQAQPFDTFTLKGNATAEIEPWFVPYHGQKLQGQALLEQIDRWEQQHIIEPSHAKALRTVQAHPEWFDLSERTLVLFGAGSEAGPLTWLTKWRANIVAIDLPSPAIWDKITSIVAKGNATLIAPQQASMEGKTQLGANLLTQTPEIANWLATLAQPLDLAGIAYLDGEKHVRVSMAMIAIMDKVSQLKPDSSIMFMLTPTDIYAVPKEVVQGSLMLRKQRNQVEKLVTHAARQLSLSHFFTPIDETLLLSDNGQQYGICDCMVIEQGPNYALAKRLQQWYALLARSRGQRVAINIAPSTTTLSVVKNPLLKAAFAGAGLFQVETFNPETTNAIMAALWVHDLHNPDSVANPQNKLEHPLKLIMEEANHGGLWRVAYLARTALPFAAAYGWGKQKLAMLQKQRSRIMQ